MKLIDFIGEKVSFDEHGGGYLWTHDAEGTIQMLAEIRAWGAIQNLFKTADGSVNSETAEAFQDGLGKWIAEAINEKIDRERVPLEFQSNGKHQHVIGIIGQPTQGKK